MSLAAPKALTYNRDDVSRLVVTYSINVLLTFALSNVAMIKHWYQVGKQDPNWWRHLPAHLLASARCTLILVVTIIENVVEGAWLTLGNTSVQMMTCFAVNRHYECVVVAIRVLDPEVSD